MPFHRKGSHEGY